MGGVREGEYPTLHCPSAAQPRNVVSPPFSSVLQAGEREQANGVEAKMMAVGARVASAWAAKARATRARRQVEQHGQAWRPLIVSPLCPWSGYDGGGGAGGGVGQLVR
jgi:hypothetical protein